MTDFLEKKPAASKAAAKPGSKTTARKASGKTKAPVPSKMIGRGSGITPSDDDISLDDEPESAPVGPRAAAPRRAAAAKAAYIELSDDDD
jgi:hypothetical protein